MWYMIYYTQNKGTAQRSNYPKSCTGVHSILKAVSLKCKKDKDDDNASKLKEIANSIHEHIYIKSDGSIDDGFEIVSHPMTLLTNLYLFQMQFLTPSCNIDADLLVIKFHKITSLLA